MAKQHTSRMPFQTRTPFGLQDGISQRAPTPRLTNTDLCFAGNFPNRQLLFFLHCKKQNKSIFITFKTLTLFLVNCAADSKIYRSKYRANIFLFEDRTSFFFFQY